MLKKENEVKWNPDSQESFSRIKRILPRLMCLLAQMIQNLSTYFLSRPPHTISIVLL